MDDKPNDVTTALEQMLRRARAVAARINTRVRQALGEQGDPPAASLPDQEEQAPPDPSRP